MMNRSLPAAMLFMALVALTACSSKETIESDMGISGAPDWVNEGTQAVDDDDGRYIQGVAFAPPLNDESLQTSTADGRARAEVARVVSSFISSTLNDYSASTGDAAASSIEQTVTSSTQTALNGSKIKGRWKDESTGNIYSFAEMDMNALDAAIKAAGKLSENFKKFYASHATANFERFVEGKQVKGNQVEGIGQ
jgi:hypothetical protein